MTIHSKRLGTVTVDDARVITVARGLLGFPAHKRFVLLDADGTFFWLQSADDPDLAFVVTDPVAFFPGHEVPLRGETAAELDMRDDQWASLQVLVICNKADGWLVGNLLGPLVVNTINMRAAQVVLTEKKWSTRQRLCECGVVGKATV